MKLLRTNTPLQNRLIVSISVLFGFCLLFLNFRIHQAILLKNHSWVEIDDANEEERIAALTESGEDNSQVKWGLYIGLQLVVITLFVFSKFLI
jgi:hypothetical protein